MPPGNPQVPPRHTPQVHPGNAQVPPDVPRWPWLTPGASRQPTGDPNNQQEPPSTVASRSLQVPLGVPEMSLVNCGFLVFSWASLGLSWACLGHLGGISNILQSFLADLAMPAPISLNILCLFPIVGPLWAGLNIRWSWWSLEGFQDHLKGVL